MEKYAVIIDDEKKKEASEKLPEGKVGKCPDCGEYIAQPFFCRHCGTLPFEKRP